MTDLIIVGAGFYGSIAKRLATSAGLSTLLIDDGRQHGASRAAAGLFSPEWLASVPAGVAELGTNVLEATYTVGRLTFATTGRKLGQRMMNRVDPASVLEHHEYGTVREVEGGKTPRVRWTKPGLDNATIDTEARVVYVTAGVWTGNLVECPEQTHRCGCAAYFRRTDSVRPHMWRLGPYQEAVLIPNDDGTLYWSDGSALTHWAQRHTERTLERAHRLAGMTEPWAIRWGYRPYSEGGAWFVRAQENVWAASGGRKTGLVTGAASAAQLVTQLTGKAWFRL